MATTPPMPPGYTWVRHLGAGGFGDVHLARQSGTDRLVAVKHIQRHALEQDPTNLDRFRREARVLAATETPTVVRVFDLDTSGDPAFLVMEYVPGVTLFDLIEAAPLPASQALAALRDVAEALRMMAAAGVVHRDLKPSNVFVLPSGRAKLGDFGLARSAEPGSGFRTRGGVPTGTPAYFPPELSAGLAEASVQSDAYSFAVMAYEALTGSRPIDALDAVSLITAHWHDEPRPPSDAMPGMPAEAGGVLLAGLAKSPGGRPTPWEMVSVLDGIEPGRWPTATLADVVPDADRTATTIRSPHAPPPPPPTGAETVAVPDAAGPAAPELPPRPTATRSTRLPRSVARRLGLVALVVVLAAGAFTARRLLLEPSDAQGDDLAVRSVSLTADSQRGRCPSTITVRAVVTTNGAAGVVEVDWRLPTGRSGPVQTVALDAGKATVEATLAVEVRGTRRLVGPVTVAVDPGGLDARLPLVRRCQG